jgi:uncharacterized protein YjbJ (UPF0337 family)
LVGEGSKPEPSGNKSLEKHKMERKKMNDDVLGGLWKQLKGRVQRKWGELTDDDFDKIQGNKEVLIGTIQEKYGYARDEAESEVNKFLESIQD